MTIQFSPGCNIAPNQRGELQIWIEKHVDRDTDFYIAVVSPVDSKHVVMRANWHKSTTGKDKEEHLTGNVIINNETVGAAHVYRNGQVTMYSVDED